TQNMPLMTMLRSWKYGFNSPFKAEVYFLNTRQFTDLKWGTPNPIMLRDSEFGMVRLRAFGAYAMRISDPAKFMREIAGTRGLVDTDAITGQLRDMVVMQFTNRLGESQVAALDLAAHYNEISKALLAKLEPDFQQYGVDLLNFIIENISLPPEVEAMLDKRTSMGIVGDMNRFTQFQAGQALEAAANNPSGGGGAMTSGLGIGAGLAMGQQMAQSISQGSNQAAAPAAPAAAPAQHSLKDRLEQLKGLLDGGLISEDDYNARKTQILGEI
nr:SPFH domain-containing protein [Armatimonadota bacterium]